MYIFSGPGARMEASYSKAARPLTFSLGREGAFVSITVTALFREVALRIIGTVPWGTPISSRACGVYAVSLSQDPNRSAGLHAQAPIDRCSVHQWISRVPTIELDKSKATVEAIIQRLSKFWIPDESILYIGKATPLRSRIKAYYATPLGDRGPHAGGHWIKTLSILHETFLHFAEVVDCERSEADLLRTFVARVSEATRQRVGDPPLPFANLELPEGKRKQRKRHGIGKCKLP